MPNYLTFADIYGQMQDFCDEDGTEFTTILKKLANNAYRQMRNADKLQPLWFAQKRATFNLAAGTRNYHDGTGGALRTAGIIDLKKVLALSVGGYECREVSREFAEREADTFYDDNTTESHPQNFLHQVEPLAAVANGVSVQNTLTFFYMPASAQAVGLVYEAAAADLSSDADIPLIPPEYHQGIVYGGMVLAEKFGLSVQALPWAQLYQDIERQMLDENRRQLNEVVRHTDFMGL